MIAGLRDKKNYPTGCGIKKSMLSRGIRGINLSRYAPNKEVWESKKRPKHGLLESKVMSETEKEKRLSGKQSRVGNRGSNKERDCGI